MSTVSPDSSVAAAMLNYTSTAAVADLDDPIVAGLRRSAWVKIGLVTLLFVAVFWPNLTRIWNKVNPIYGDPNWQHGIFVPLISLYFLYVNREELLRTPVRASWTGLGVLLVGLLLSMYSVWPLQNDFVWDFGMVLTLFGVVLLTCGWQVMKITWFPIAFLVCAIPWPGLFYSEIAWPLQQFAAKVAVKVMSYGGVDAARSGTRIFFLAKDGELRPLNVAEACAGLRSLMTFISLAAAIAFLSNRPLWQRAIIVLSAIPIAILCNVMRVSGQGLTDYYISEQFSRGFAHTFYGLVMYVPAFFMVLMVVWILDHLFLDEADEREKAKLASAARSKLIVTKAAAAAGVPAAKPAMATAAAAAAVAPAPTSPAAVKTATIAAAPPVRRTAPPAAQPAAVPARPAAAAAATPVAKPGAAAKPATATTAVKPAAAVTVKPPPAAGRPAGVSQPRPATTPRPQSPARQSPPPQAQQPKAPARPNIQPPQSNQQQQQEGKR